jgi:polyhydroxyalkanoate synthase subunit PhaE
MTTHGPDFMSDYQGFARQAWDAWSRSLQPQSGSAGPSFFTQPSAKPTVDETLERSLAGFRSYLEWLKSAAGSGLEQGGGDWQQQLQRLFGGGQPGFAQAFGGIGSTSVQGFGEQWQRWLQAAQPAGLGDMRDMLQTPAFGYAREQQEQQQALQRAILDHLEASKRYQDLMLRAQMQGADRLQQKLAERTQANQPVESLKALYDLWIDAAEEAYAGIALSDEFREVYGAQVNTQMLVRKLQKEQLEQLCAQLGMPTASEVASLGKRLQELRREMRELARTANAARAGAGRKPEPAVKTAATRKRPPPGAQARKPPASTRAVKAKAGKATKPAPAKATRKAPAHATPRKRR